MTTPNHYMQRALELAHLGLGKVSPNPMVGCVIVKSGHIIGEGYHQRAGAAHAEILALAMAGEQAKEATLYTTLEPCCHYGKTPPCTEAIIKAGIKQVYVACLDPNPLVAGKGIRALESAGITVITGVEETAALQLNEVFFHYITTKRPFVIAKWAMSLDGKTVTHNTDDKKISNSTSQAHAHQTRKTVDAILVGSHTILQDDPLLTARTNEGEIKQPLRVILSSDCHLPSDAKIFNTEAKTLVVTTNKALLAAREKLIKKHVEVITVKQSIDNRILLPALLDELGKRDITSLLVEGGMTVLENFFKENLVNKINLYLAPVIIGKQDKKYRLSNIMHTVMNGDHYFSADLSGENHV